MRVRMFNQLRPSLCVRASHTHILIRRTMATMQSCAPHVGMDHREQQYARAQIERWSMAMLLVRMHRGDATV